MKYVILIHSNPQPWGHPTGNGGPEMAGQREGRVTAVRMASRSLRRAVAVGAERPC